MEFDLDVKDERRVKLHQVAPEVKNKLAYEYDFGYGWDHEILVKRFGTRSTRNTAKC